MSDEAKPTRLSEMDIRNAALTLAVTARARTVTDGKDFVALAERFAHYLRTGENEGFGS